MSVGVHVMRASCHSQRLERLETTHGSWAHVIVEEALVAAGLSWRILGGRPLELDGDAVGHLHRARETQVVT